MDVVTQELEEGKSFADLVYATHKTIDERRIMSLLLDKSRMRFQTYCAARDGCCSADCGSTILHYRQPIQESGRSKSAWAGWTRLPRRAIDPAYKAFADEIHNRFIVCSFWEWAVRRSPRSVVAKPLHRWKLLSLAILDSTDLNVISGSGNFPPDKVYTLLPANRRHRGSHGGV
jgi:hypothetical protein